MQTFGRFGKVVYGPQYTLDFQQKMKKKKTLTVQKPSTILAALTPSSLAFQVTLNLIVSVLKMKGLPLCPLMLKGK